MSAGPQPTCRGLSATHVGTPRAELVGTEGDDVIVSNGARKVRAGRGDDVVCLTGDTHRVIVRDGGGDDVVTARAFDGRVIVARIGSGSDRYLGSPVPDLVSLNNGHDGDRDLVQTFAGDDSVYALGNRPGTEARVALGVGDDDAYIREQVAARVDGGEGRDFVAANCDCDHAVARLVRAVVTYDGAMHVIRDFEGVHVHGARQAELYGSERADYLATDACVTTLEGRGGDDTLSHDENYDDCIPTSSLYGGPGDDVLLGYDGPDRLYGGRGRDEADGGQGRDLCRAEQKVGCEV